MQIQENRNSDTLLPKYCEFRRYAGDKNIAGDRNCRSNCWNVMFAGITRGFSSSNRPGTGALLRVFTTLNVSEQGKKYLLLTHYVPVRGH